MPAASRPSCIARPERFGLTSPTRTLDPRTHAFRRDIADIGLAADVFAPHYARPVIRHVAAASTMVHAAPDAAATATSQLLHGEGFAVVDEAAGWAWGRCLHDDYVGYLPAAALGAVEDATHRVVTPSALLFAMRDIKSAVLGYLPIGARIAGTRAEGFVAAAGGFVHHRHLAPIGALDGDPAAVAERLLGQPYLWGGRGAGGIDCSGLVQLAFGLCGTATPRDSDQQRSSLGIPLAPDTPLQRNDLVFLPGHVGIMVDAERIVHANAHWMAVTVEPLADVVARQGDGAILACQRVGA